MFEWVFALAGFLIMLGMLVGIGINEPRGTSMKTWCFGYLAISVIFDLLVLVALVSAAQLVWLTDLLLGLSAGAATGLAVHVAHHISEAEQEEKKGAGNDQKSIFGF